MKIKKQRRRQIMSKTKKRTTRVTVDFPKAEHRKLKAMAALEGVTLQDYIRSRVSPEIEENDIADSALSPIVKKILKENKNALKRLADKWSNI